MRLTRYDGGANGDLNIMTLTQNFSATIHLRIESDPAFREELLKEGLECLHSGDVDTCKAMLRDYVNTTIRFQALGRRTGKSPRSLRRMLDPKGNPRARDLVRIIDRLREQERV